jgi:hypothetical protein
MASMRLWVLIIHVHGSTLLRNAAAVADSAA